jgi:hypothetical protein
MTAAEGDSGGAGGHVGDGARWWGCRYRTRWRINASGGSGAHGSVRVSGFGGLFTTGRRGGRGGGRGEGPVWDQWQVGGDVMRRGRDGTASTTGGGRGQQGGE